MAVTMPGVLFDVQFEIGARVSGVDLLFWQVIRRQARRAQARVGRRRVVMQCVQGGHIHDAGNRFAAQTGASEVRSFLFGKSNKLHVTGRLKTFVNKRAQCFKAGADAVNAVQRSTVPHGIKM